MHELLLPILTPYGDVTVGGSYAYRLLTYPDLDIDIVSERVAKDTCAELCAALIRLEHTTKCKVADRVRYPHTHSGDRPTGYWIAPEISFGEHLWNIDIWLQQPAWHTGDTSRYTQALLAASEEQRIATLTLKDTLRAQHLYGVGKEFGSVTVYEGVLRGNVRTVDELRSFMRSVL